MDNEKHREHIAALQQEAAAAMQLAREARAAVTAAYEACIFRDGPGPTDEQLDRTNRLELEAAGKTVQVRLLSELKNLWRRS
jgi:hypothetical protein